MAPVSRTEKGEKSQKKALKYFGPGYTCTVISKKYRLGRHLEIDYTVKSLGPGISQ
jgi:hypothetical protein